MATRRHRNCSGWKARDLVVTRLNQIVQDRDNLARKLTERVQECEALHQGAHKLREEIRALQDEIKYSIERYDRLLSAKEAVMRQVSHERTLNESLHRKLEIINDVSSILLAGTEIKPLPICLGEPEEIKANEDES